MWRATTTALLLFAGQASAAARTADQIVCTDPYDSGQLSEAFDAALMELLATPGWFPGLQRDTDYSGLVVIAACTADPDKWEYPPAETANGLLKKVLETGEIRVSGKAWKAGNVDYVRNTGPNPKPAVGFWPEFMNAIVGKMSDHYGIQININRRYYPSSPEAIAAVEKNPDDVHLSEPYYYQSGFHDGGPRIEAFHSSCPTAGTASYFVTATGSGITDTDALYSHIADADVNDLSNRRVGFIGSGNFDSVASILPANVLADIPSDAVDARYFLDKLDVGSNIAYFHSEGSQAPFAEYNIFTTGILSPRVSLFRKYDPLCTYHGAPPPPPPPCESAMTEMVIALIIVAALGLVVSLLLTYTIFRERVQKPIFMPLLKPLPSQAGVTSAIETGSV